MTTTEKQYYTVVLHSDTLTLGGSFEDADSDSNGSGIAYGPLTEKGVENVTAKLLELGFTSVWTIVEQPRGYTLSPSYLLQLVSNELKMQAAPKISVEVTAKDILDGSVDLTDGVYLYNNSEITHWGYRAGLLVLSTLNVDTVLEVELPHTFTKVLM